MAETFRCTKQCAYLAVKKYAKDNADSLRLVSFDQCDESKDENDNEYTIFDGISTNGERFTVDMSDRDIFFDLDKRKMRKMKDFNSEFVKILFKNIRKPCCWSFGKPHTLDGEININGICLNEKCEAAITIITENIR